MSDFQILRDTRLDEPEDFYTPWCEKVDDLLPAPTWYYLYDDFGFMKREKEVTDLYNRLFDSGRSPELAAAMITRIYKNAPAED